MLAVGVHEFGCASKLAVMDVSPPVPQAGEVVVRLEYAGVNFIDVYMRSGIYQRSDTYKTPLPLLLGMEGGGTVVACGEGVSEFAEGDQVAYCLSRGSYAEYAAVPAWRLVPVPPAIPMETAVAAMLQASTAHYLTHSAFPLKPGDWCLIHAAAGGVGQLLTQFAKRRGATVIATAGTPEKAAVAKQRGADHVILYRSEDFRARVMDLTEGRGVDVVYDSVGRDTIAKSIRSLRKRGTCILFGASSGVVESIEPLELAEAGSVFFTRPHLADYMQNADEIRGRARDIFAAIEGGDLSIAIDSIFPLVDIAGAHRHIESRATQGKILIRIAP
jgi:NADPH2:quinone reductase